MKKGQGLSVNMLILIALGLAVLIISIIIFANRTKDANSKLDTTSSCGFTGEGSCSDSADGQCPAGEHKAIGFCPEKKVCCAKDSPS